MKINTFKQVPLNYKSNLLITPRLYLLRMANYCLLSFALVFVVFVFVSQGSAVSLSNCYWTIPRSLTSFLIYCGHGRNILNVFLNENVLDSSNFIKFNAFFSEWSSDSVQFCSELKNPVRSIHLLDCTPRYQLLGATTFVVPLPLYRGLTLTSSD